jgi:protein-S-isoprenylcysteine O-methyltransferase Ste14
LRRVTFPKAYADQVARIRVPSGFILLAAFVWLAQPTLESLSRGLLISIFGLAIRAWAAGHLEKNMTLAESGPYAWVRNPLYLGTLTVAAGFVIASRRWELAVLFGAVFVLVYLPVVELEEQHLANLFPEFADYKRRVPKLVPRIPHHTDTKPFRWSVYRRNEEYQALAGFLLGAAVLLWKALR